MDDVGLCDVIGVIQLAEIYVGDVRVALSLSCVCGTPHVFWWLCNPTSHVSLIIRYEDAPFVMYYAGQNDYLFNSEE